jgi:hypothetical protein
MWPGALQSRKRSPKRADQVGAGVGGEVLYLVRAAGLSLSHLDAPRVGRRRLTTTARLVVVGTADHVERATSIWTTIATNMHAAMATRGAMSGRTAARDRRQRAILARRQEVCCTSSHGQAQQSKANGSRSSRSSMACRRRARAHRETMTDGTPVLKGQRTQENR